MELTLSILTTVRLSSKELHVLSLQLFLVPYVKIIVRRWFEPSPSQRTNKNTPVLQGYFYYAEMQVRT
jgi:hypothetical protein